MSLKDLSDMKPFDYLCDAVEKELARDAVRVAEGVAENLRACIEGRSVDAQYSNIMCVLKLIDVQGHITHIGRGKYTELERSGHYVSQKGAELSPKV